MTVLAKPKSKMLKKTLVLVEIANRWLYDQMDLRRVIDVMFPSYVFGNLSRIDICADFIAKDRELEIIQKLASGDYYVGGKKLGVVFYEEKKDRIPYCLNFGSVQSDVKWKLYNKSKEIDATSSAPTKPWITARWRNAGMPMSGIWRLEVSFHGEKFADDNGVHLGLFDMYNVDLLSLVFDEFYTHRFQIRERGHSRRSNDKVVPFLEMPKNIKDYVVRQRIRTTGRYDDTCEMLKLLNRVMASWEKGVVDPMRSNMKDLICSICDTYGYYNYVRNRWDWDFSDGNPRKVLRG